MPILHNQSCLATSFPVNSLSIFSTVYPPPPARVILIKKTNIIILFVLLIASSDCQMPQDEKSKLLNLANNKFAVWLQPTPPSSSFPVSHPIHSMLIQSKATGCYFLMPLFIHCLDVSSFPLSIWKTSYIHVGIQLPVHLPICLFIHLIY